MRFEQLSERVRPSFHGEIKGRSRYSVQARGNISLVTAGIAVISEVAGRFQRWGNKPWMFFNMRVRHLICRNEWFLIRPVAILQTLPIGFVHFRAEFLKVFLSYYTA